MNLANRIQKLRKKKGISQEELADRIGVSRQAVSKWESEQSLPDVAKIILLSEYFEVTTDYLLKGIELVNDVKNVKEKHIDARIFTAVATVLNFIGLVVAILIWIEEQTPASVAVGLIVMAVAGMIFAVGQLIGMHKKEASAYFWIINIWFVSLMPISCIFNCVQGILGGYWWTFTPIPQLGNSLVNYGLCWLVYIGTCVVTVIINVRKAYFLRKNLVE